MVHSELEQNSLSCSAPGLLLFDHLAVPTDSEEDRLDPAVPAMWNALCMCNPLTQQVVFVRLPPTHGGAAPDDPMASSRMDGPLLHKHVLLHAGSGPGFTIYDLSWAPAMLFKLRVQQAAPGASGGSDLVPLQKRVMQSTAHWTTVQRLAIANVHVHMDALPQGYDQHLILCTKSVVVKTVIRSLCVRRVAADQYKAVFVDYNMDKDEWEDETEVGGVPAAVFGHEVYPSYGAASLAMVSIGENAVLWLLHSRHDLQVDAAGPEEETTALPRETSMPVDMYVYNPEARAFVPVADRIWIPTTHSVAQGGGHPLHHNFIYLGPIHQCDYVQRGG